LSMRYAGGVCPRIAQLGGEGVKAGGVVKKTKRGKGDSFYHTNVWGEGHSPLPSGRAFRGCEENPGGALTWGRGGGLRIGQR